MIVIRPPSPLRDILALARSMGLTVLISTYGVVSAGSNQPVWLFFSKTPRHKLERGAPTGLKLKWQAGLSLEEHQH